MQFRRFIASQTQVAQRPFPSLGDSDNTIGEDFHREGKY
jgi:hypothetical protein